MMTPTAQEIARRITSMSDQDIGRTLSGGYGADASTRMTNDLRHAMSVLAVMLETDEHDRR